MEFKVCVCVVCVCVCVCFPSEDAHSSDSSLGAHLLSPVFWSAGGTLLAAFQSKQISIWTVNGGSAYAPLSL